MTHFKNAVAAYLNHLTCLRQGSKYEAESFLQKAKNFAAKHKVENNLRGIVMCDVIDTAVDIRWGLRKAAA